MRRLKKLLALPAIYREELLRELDKPRSEQVLTVDHVLEATTAASLLRKRAVIDEKTEDILRRAIIKKFRSRVINSTVAPRKLARLARAVARNEVPLRTAQRVVHRLISENDYDIDSAFRDSVEQVDFEHGVEQLAGRLEVAIEEHQHRNYKVSPALEQRLKGLLTSIRRILAG